MVHDEDIGESFFVIDHYMPRASDGTHDYTNLYYSCYVCNLRKHDTWPSDAERVHGLGFCDPCAEWDYGEHFAEDSASALEQLTRKGKYHVDQIRLNRSELIEKRKYRNELLDLIDVVKAELAKGNLTGAGAQNIMAKLERIERRVALAIPLLPRR